VTILLRLIGILALAYLAGFLFFLVTLPKAAPENVRADGIVALTGGDQRLDTAVALLEHHAAKRLLITGVYQTVTKDELKRLSHGGPRFDCCADIGYAAEDTHGNAEEAASWAREHHYQSLIVVTARYHMPRSLTEFAAEMPTVRLVPYPVEPSPEDIASLWNAPGTITMLHGEYAKYLASLVTTSWTRPASGHRA
jgi:uncharacterized SAM-binding protein YcdF (DUF218 family)